MGNVRGKGPGQPRRAEQAHDAQPDGSAAELDGVDARNDDEATTGVQPKPRPTAQRPPAGTPRAATAEQHAPTTAAPRAEAGNRGRGTTLPASADSDAPGRTKMSGASVSADFCPPSAPEGLGARGGAFWGWAVDAFDFDRQELELLAEACRQMDELEALAAAIAEHGPMVGGSQGQPRVNPALAEARNGRAALRRMLAALDLPEVPADGATGASAAAEARAAEERSSRARAAAEARWARQGDRKGRKHG